MRRRGFAVVALPACLLCLVPVVLLIPVAAGAAGGRGGTAPVAGAVLATEQAILTAADGAAGDQLGWSVDIDGDTAVVGAPHDDVDGSAGQGSAFVFVRSGGVWTQQAQLTAEAGAAGDQFGRAVAVDGDTVLVGAPSSDAGGNLDQGAVCVFTRSGATWQQQAMLLAPDGVAHSGFGWSVDLDDGTALVGDPYAKPAFLMNAGSAYVFVGAGASWSFQQQLTAPGAAESDLLGWSVALDGDVAVAGAPEDNAGTAVDHGSATVFVRSGSTWSAQAELTGSGAASNERFGDAVSLDAGTAVIGAPFEHVGTVKDQGAAYVFTGSGATWALQQRLLGTDREPQDDHFGGAVVVRGDRLLVGAPENEVELGNGTDSWSQGTVFAFVRSGAAWNRQARLTETSGASWDHFGFSVSLSGDTALAGALDDDVGGRADQGSARVLVGAAPVTTAKLTPAANADGWNNTPVTVTMSARDVFSGVALTQYRRLGVVDWTAYAAPFPVSENGVTTWEYASRDRDGNTEAAKRLKVRIDTTRPVTVAINDASVVRGARVTLRFRVDDKVAPKAYGRIRIYKGTVLKTFSMFPLSPTNTVLRNTFVCRLAPGRYTWKVYAADIADNRQSKIGSRTLTVR